ncbi:uncharacterized protein BJX67DRAFT_248048 [Aspergillus lucknowensis]|uniref:Uncharacterized protein n=1 Tax=Aspergillus lucknowensis TaxID=176173 RepID=A0ABR4M1W5_9EURO
MLSPAAPNKQRRTSLNGPGSPSSSTRQSSTCHRNEEGTCFPVSRSVLHIWQVSRGCQEAYRSQKIQYEDGHVSGAEEHGGVPKVHHGLDLLLPFSDKLSLKVPGEFCDLLFCESSARQVSHCKIVQVAETGPPRQYLFSGTQSALTTNYREMFWRPVHDRLRVDMTPPILIGRYGIIPVTIVFSECLILKTTIALIVFEA